MAETILETIDFEYNLDGFSDIEDVVKSTITMSTQIKDVPEKLYNIVGTLLGFLKSNTMDNFNDFAEKFNEYINQELSDLHDTITDELKLVPGDYYDINTEHSNTADASYKIFLSEDGTTAHNFTELMNDVDSRIDNKTTLSNTLLTDVIKAVKVYNANFADNANIANNALNFDGKDYDALITDVLTRVDNGLTMDEVQDKVENEFISYKSNDTNAFNGLSYDDFNDHIISDLKIDEATQADKLSTPDGPKDYNDLYDTIKSNLLDEINSNIITSENETLIDIIKNTKVSKSEKADLSDGSNYLLYSHDDTVEHKAYTDIINDVVDVKVNNSVEADRLTVPDSDEVKTYTDIINDAQDLVNNLKTDLENGDVDVDIDIDEVDKAHYLLDDDDYQHSYSDILSDIDDKISNYNTDLINGLEDGTIIPEYSNHSVESDHSTLADASDYLRFYDNDEEDYVNVSYSDIIRVAEDNAVQTSTELFDDNLKILFRTYSPDINEVLDNPLYTLNYATVNSDYDLKAYSNESADYISDSFVMKDVDNIIGAVLKKTFEYSDGNLTDIYYWNSSDDQIRHDTFAYNDDGNISEVHNIQRFYNIDLDNGDEAGTYDFDYKYLYTYNDDGTIKEINFDGLTITSVE